MDPETNSDLILNSKTCKKCGAKWLNGRHYWSTGKLGNTRALSNLVCSLAESPDCINPMHFKGRIYTDEDSWEKRRKFIDENYKGSGDDASWKNYEI